MRKYEEMLEIMCNKVTDAVIVSDSNNIRYLCGFSGGEGYLYISQKRQCLIVDSRYTLWAKNECDGVEVVTSDDHFATLIKLMADDGVEIIALEGAHLIYNDLENMGQALKCKGVVILEDDITNLRMIKDAYEIECISKAEAIGDEAFSYILNYLRPGVTEKEVALELEMYMRKNGADRLSFDVISASGPNSACPHLNPADRSLCEGDFLTMDFGCVYKGYCSDMTRTVVIGKATDRHREIYNLVLNAQQKAIDNICAGMSGIEADSVARTIIEDAGYGNCFGHGLGHGVGLYIHEAPRLSKKGENILKPGMVVTVEPGIYIEGFGGVRIEDVVVIEENGVRNLTKSDKSLIEIC